jgi:hypothetical protein
MARAPQELGWPLPAGGILVLAFVLLQYALRGPDVTLPAGAGAAALVLLAAWALGVAARAGAGALAWAVYAVTAADLFLDRAAVELLDESSTHALGADLRERVRRGFAQELALEVSCIADRDDDPMRQEKALRIDEALSLARANLRRGPNAATVDALDARIDGARAFVVAMGSAAGLVLVTGVHDLLLGKSVAHALSGFALIALGLVLSVGAVAALGRARSVARAAARDLMLSVAVAENGAPAR